ncbi:hypothetical protein D3C80_1805410 [compost metagenome]
MDRDQLAYATGCTSAGISCRLYCTYIAANHNCNKTEAHLLIAANFYVRCFYHGIRCFYCSYEALRFNQSECFSHC